MSFEEKGTWIFSVVTPALSGIYFATIYGQLQNTAVTEIAYQGLLIGLIAAAIVLTIVATIVAAILSPRDAGQSDQRDKEINRLGEYVGGAILGFGMILPFGLAMAEQPHFWIANAMYLVFVVSGLIGAAVKLFVYRRGF